MLNGRVIEQDGWVLMDAFGQRVRMFSKHTDFRGDEHTVEGGSYPHKPSSSGRIRTNLGEFFPGVCNLHWEKEE